MLFVLQRAGSLLLLLLFLSGCSARGPNTPVSIAEQGLQEPAPASLASISPSYVIHSGDELEIKFFYNSSLNETVTVRSDGRISLQLVHEVQAAALTTNELAAVLKEKYASFLKEPEVSVLVRSFDSQRIFVDGQVFSPGMITMGGHMTILQSIASAGGLRDSARGGQVLVIRRNGLKKPFVLTVDVDAARDGSDIAQDISLESYDIVYVPKSPIAHVNTFVDLYLRKNIPFNLNLGWFKSFD